MLSAGVGAAARHTRRTCQIGAGQRTADPFPAAAEIPRRHQLRSAGNYGSDSRLWREGVLAGRYLAGL